MTRIVFKILFWFLSLLAAPIILNSYILAVVYFISLKQRLRPNLKVFQCQPWTSVKKWAE